MRKTSRLSPEQTATGFRFSQPAPAGFTLLELLVVVALLVVLISLAVPSLTAMMNQQRLMDQAGQVEQFLTNLRRDAAMSGETRWVRYASADKIIMSGPQNEPANNSLTLADEFEFGRHELAESVESEELGSVGLEGMNLLWSPEVLFYPDGTADDVELILKNQKQQFYRISIRGLTGQVRLSQGNSQEASDL